ncbi:MAG TPA: peptidoglycan-binding domain-containing protein [Acidobacteriaceae bacterium]
MRFFRNLTTIATMLFAVALPAIAATHARRGPTSHLFVKKKLKSGFRPAGAIAPQRTTQIQTALIRAGYLTGEPTGAWDTPTQQALQKLQGDNGWQTKLTPDSRALIKLGLGPGSTPPETATADTSASQESSN